MVAKEVTFKKALKKVPRKTRQHSNTVREVLETFNSGANEIVQIKDNNHEFNNNEDMRRGFLYFIEKDKYRDVEVFINDGIVYLAKKKALEEYRKSLVEVKKKRRKCS